jgi:protein involved in polysaccharide export with SLBB domain
MSSIVNGADGRVKLEAGDRIIVNQSAYVGKSLTILGQVGRQGPIPFPVSGRLDLVTAIAYAGGLGELANPKKITVNRKGKIIILDYKEISQRGDQPFLLLPDDIVNVPERLF